MFNGLSQCRINIKWVVVNHKRLALLLLTGGSLSRWAATLPEKMQDKRSCQIHFNFGFSYKISQHNNVQYLRYHFGSTFPRNSTKLMFCSFPTLSLMRYVFNTLADEFGGFKAVFGTALKERNQAIGSKKHDSISAYHKAFLLLWGWIFKEKTEKVSSWLVFTAWISWILNFMIKFNNAATSSFGDIGSTGFQSGG